MILATRFATTALALSLAAATAQTPEDPPPWWGAVDNDTVNLYWDFDNAAQPFVPTVAIVPTWFTPPPNDGFAASPGITQIPLLGGNTGVIGFSGTGQESIALEINNDPRPNWLKVFWIQFDSFSGGGGEVAAKVREDLVRYQRAIISEETKSLGNGWERTTIGSYLIPQPDFETVDFELSLTIAGDVAIDNLFVNSKCIKPNPDEKGEALGELDQNLLNIDLNAATGNQETNAVALTQDLGGVPTYWVAGRSGNGLTHPVFRLDPTGRTDRASRSDPDDHQCTAEPHGPDRRQAARRRPTPRLRRRRRGSPPQQRRRPAAVHRRTDGGLRGGAHRHNCKLRGSGTVWRRVVATR